MSKCRSFLRGINPLLMMNRAGHRVFQQVAPGVCMHAAAGGEEPCFYIVSASVGDNPSNAAIATITFNADADLATCGVELPWNFKIDGGPAYSQSITNIVGPNLTYTLKSAEADSVDPLHTVTVDYTPGTCHKLGATGDDECLLDPYVNYPITNRVYGPNATRIGDVGDDVVLVGFPVTPAEPGFSNDWQVRVNDNPVTINNTQIVADTVRLTLAAPVTNSDVVHVSHLSSSAGCKAVDGRFCWQFFKMPVLNVVGVSFWNREDEGPWLLDAKTHRWRLES